MKRLSLEELKATAGKNVISRMEDFNGGDSRPPIKLPPPKPMPCDNV